MKILKINITFLYLTVFLSLIILSTTSQAKVLYGVSVGGNRDYPGGDYANFATPTLEDCVLNCANDGRCVAFSYVPHARTCFLKDRLTQAVRAPGIKSGRKLAPGGAAPPPPPPHQGNMRFFPETNLPGGDYHNRPANDPEQCAQFCMGDIRCRAFTYMPSNRICWLKSFQPELRKNYGTISGLKN